MDYTLNLEDSINRSDTNTSFCYTNYSYLNPSAHLYKVSSIYIYINKKTKGNEIVVLTLLLLLLVEVGAPFAPAPTSAAPWPPAPNMAPGPNSVPGRPFWGGGGGGNAVKGGATKPSCPPVESWEPCGSGGRRGRQRQLNIYSQWAFYSDCSSLTEREWGG